MSWKRQPLLARIAQMNWKQRVLVVVCLGLFVGLMPRATVTEGELARGKWSEYLVFRLAAERMVVGELPNVVDRADGFDNHAAAFEDYLQIDVDDKLEYRLKEHVYSYPPLLAMLSVPFTLIPDYDLGAILWGLLIVGAIFAGVALTLMCLKIGVQVPTLVSQEGQQKHDLAFGWKIASVVICFGALLGPLSNQQCDSILFFWVILGLLALISKQHVVAALLFGAAAGSKGPLLVLVPWLFWTKRYAVGALTTFFAIGLNLLPDLLFPLNDGSSYLGHWVQQVVAPTLHSDGVVATTQGVWGRFNVQNQALGAMLTRLFADGRGENVLPGLAALSPSALKMLTLATYAAIAGAIVILTLRRRSSSQSTSHVARDGLHDISIVLILSLLFSPMTSPAHLCMLYSGFVVLLWAALHYRDWFLRSCLVMGGLLLAFVHKDLVGREAVEFLRFYGVQTVEMLLLLLGLLRLYQLRRQEEESSPSTVVGDNVSVVEGPQA